MKLKKNGKSVNHVFHAAAMLPTAVFSVGLAIPVSTAHATIAQPDEIIVTARRTEEVLQNVPISMTVFNQDMLTERNVSNGADLATYTPSLAVNTRFGADQTTFAIRGFTQELRTTASVAVYFADVVAPRGGGSISSGDGAGPGSFFDLQNVQVLKGPQGTLFGRNTTGGAIQLVPQEPTSKLEGYLEQSAGNFNMRRTQAVINVPIADSVRARFGIDTQKRDGYLINQSDVGPHDLANVDYTATRASVMWDVTNSVTNYTILTHTVSENNGGLQGLKWCRPADPANPASAQTAALCQAALDANGKGFYDVSNTDSTLDPTSKLKQTQIINTTTWNVNDSFTVKNNLAYGKLNQTTRTAVFGSMFGPYVFSASGQWPGTPTNAQNTLVEERQFSGSALAGNALTWQAGLYYENSKPDGISGSLSPSLINCNWPLGGDPSQWRCPTVIPLGNAAGTLSDISAVVSNLGKIEYTNEAAYAQGTYDISDEFRLTLGLRYTIDKTDGGSRAKVYQFPLDGSGIAAAPTCAILGLDPNTCDQKLHTTSEAPTWLIDFDYLPTPDVMVYTKYARGYRQGAISMFSPSGLQVFDPEKVDAYEIGAKTTFGGPIPGTFNIAAFYNELSNQQIQGQYVPCNLAVITGGSPQCQGSNAQGPFGAPTTAILNAGSSTIQGFDVETTLKLLDSLIFTTSYTYLETHLDSLASAPLAAKYVAQPSAVVGGHLSFSPTHSVTSALSYTLPVPKEVGDVSAGASYTFVSDQLSTATDPSIQGSPYGHLPSHRLLNLNMGWKAVMGSQFDASLFMTNALNEKYITYVSGLYNQFGFEYGVTGEPKMWGGRIKYNFQ